MANNSDIPRGFRPVQTLSGAPVSGKMRVFTVDSSNGERITVGDALQLEADGNIALAASGTDVLGVAMGFGDASDVEFGTADGFDPDNLNTPYFVPATKANAYQVLVCLANDVIFECQTDDSSIAVDVGDQTDLIATASTGTTSVMEVDYDGTPANNDARVVETPTYNEFNLKDSAVNTYDNDPDSANAAVYVVFNNPTFAQA